MTNAVRKRILIPVDGSENALDAVRYAGKTLAGKPAELVLFHVMTRIPESFWDLQKEPSFQYKIANIKAWEMQQEKMIQEFMEKARQILDEAGARPEAVSVIIQERQTGIARDILAESQKGYDAVVVGRKGLSPLKDLVLGSIAGKLIEKIVHIPLWIVGTGTQNGKMLISMDTSRGAMQAVDYVASLLQGAASSTRVTLIHVIRGFDVFQPILGQSFVPGHEEDWIARAERELNEASREMDPVFEDAFERLVNAGFSEDLVIQKTVKGASSRAGAIVEEAEEGGYDTIVVGRRGLSTVQEFFMGRVSNKVIQLAKNKTVWVVS